MQKINLKGSDFMIKKIAWDTFKNTGDINAFLELKQIENIEKSIQSKPLNTDMNLNEEIKTNLKKDENKWQI